ncbi:MAG: hypothetical protein K6C40_13530 [Thermoguttaceae bacterium]|nr:hypothetical protein [Thermoguttaceae bacterium]
MSSVPFSERVKRFWNSRPAVQFRRATRRFVSLRWWVKRSWKTKVQLLIGLTALLLLALSIAAWHVFRVEYSKISNNFLRLQLFGPQEIFFQPPGSPKDGPKSNFCPYYLEVRRPYGGALANVRVEASFQTLDDAPFWFLSDGTNREGRFQLDVPDMQMPERVKLKIHAEHGRKSADFTAYLKARNLQEVESRTENLSESPFLFEDRPLNSVLVPQLEFAPENPISLVIPHRVFENQELSFSVLTSEEQFHPVFVGIWQNGKLLTCRPILARKKWRNAAISLPEDVFGMCSVLLIDSAVSPPRVVQHELIYRLPPKDLELEAAQRVFLRSFAKQLNTPEFRAEKQSLEYLPGELEEPAEGPGLENPALLAAADRLLGGVIVTKPTPGTGVASPDLEPLERLLGNLDQLSIQLFDPPPEMSFNPESICLLMDRALKLQGIFLRRNLGSQSVQAQYAPSLPVVFDSLSVQEESYRMAVEKFRQNVKKRLGSLVCLILCSALCLVVMMLMMTILGLPTDWRNWLLTFCVVLLALGLASVISSQSDVDSAGESAHYAIFEGVPGP